MAAGAPSDLVVPTAIASLAAGRPLSLVWANEAGGLTFELGEGSSRRFIKWGDGCAPNTLIGADGRWCGHVDLGLLGTADRWADLAVATWSTRWNYGPGWERPLLNAYGIAPDPDRTRYYRLLWDLSS